ncbi:hypothetical protein J5N97_001918 [Dioscorea zingiberensis]|uniref:GBF-interacting protein 1 N-terminal domain-containing protein n=1 Tax=Dioscorea zingiberensis TaxID=325984 RepID=A0A9D5H1U5_9LILI|nr:hypothetical protein J5N97_001918 [Dioscorea zingiberensis]
MGRAILEYQGIPAGSRKMVQSLKEIVNNCTEQEIYAMLKDCNMDPNEAVNRLLASRSKLSFSSLFFDFLGFVVLDPFHEVKSKREKKKESKEPTDSRSRGANISNHGARESGSLHGRPAYRKENGTPAYAGSSSSAAGTTGYNLSRSTTSILQDCLHLSFEVSDPTLSLIFRGSHPVKSDLEETSVAVDVSAVGHSDARNPDYYGDEHLINTSDGSLVHRTGASAGDYDSPSVSQPEVLKQETPEAGQGIQYTFPSAPGFAYDSSQQLNMAFSHPQSSQNDNSRHVGSRTWFPKAMPAVPASNYYSFQGQNQQHAGFRQTQQPSQQFAGALNYRTSIILRQGCPSIINSKVQGAHPWVAHRDNLLSSLNKYGKTATNLITSWFFRVSY